MRAQSTGALLGPELVLRQWQSPPLAALFVFVAPDLIFFSEITLLNHEGLSVWVLCAGVVRGVGIARVSHERARMSNRRMPNGTAVAKLANPKRGAKKN